MRGFPFVSEVLFFRESYGQSIMKIMLNIVGDQEKKYCQYRTTYLDHSP